MSQDGVRNSASPKNKPSAIPWEMIEVSGSDACPLAQAEVFSSASVIWIAQVMEPADAALIVKAVNLHNELVEIITLMVADEDFEGLCQEIGEEPKWLKMAKAVLAKAGSQ